MRTDLKLNYGALDAISARISAYHDAIDDMEQALNKLKGVLENQESEAVEKLLEKIGSTTTNLGDKKTTLKLLKNILDEYTEDMEALVGAVNRNERVRADQYDIWYNITQIESPVNTLDYNASVVAWGNSSWSLPFEDEEGKQKREKEERNYQKLENLRTGKLVSLAKRLQQNVSDLWGIYDNYIKPFEKTDDEYRKRLNTIYKDRTSKKDKWNNFWDSFGSISVSFLKSFVVAFAAAFALALAPTWLVVGALAVLAVGCIIMANVPEESVPSWLSGAKKAADAVADKAVQVLEEGPIVLVEDIGQGFMDQIQTPEGIAAVSGEVIGGITGGIAGAKVKSNIKAKKAETGELTEPKVEDVTGGKNSILSYEEAEEIAFDATKGGKKADSVVLGKYGDGGPTAYTNVAKDMDAQYFELDNWSELAAKYSDDEIWKINQKFLDIQTSSGREIYLSHNPADYIGDGSFYSREIQYLIDNGYKFVDEGGIWHAVR